MLQTRLFLFALFFMLFVIAAVGWVVRPFTALAAWGRRARRGVSLTVD